MGLILVLLAVFLGGPDLLHYAQGAPGRWRELVPRKLGGLEKSQALQPREIPTIGQLELNKPATYADLQTYHDSLLTAMVDTLQPKLVPGRCPFCVKLGWKSNVDTPIWCTSTAMAWRTYYDESGKFHSDNPNIITISYSCSQGHRWVQRKRAGGLE